MAELCKRTFYGRIRGKKYWHNPSGSWKLLVIPVFYGFALLLNIIYFLARPALSLNLIVALVMVWFVIPYVKNILKIRREEHIFTRYTLLRDSVDDEGQVSYFVQWNDGSTGWIKVRSGIRQRFSFQEVS